eukprot:GHVO01029479.1.p2 GENE.GHVO01029479.1~~GHVO01029479.1.p2  ORF type:complete len:351 (-),score=80.64 GHVO01029479.1:116-1168(-)
MVSEVQDPPSQVDDKRSEDYRQEMIRRAVVSSHEDNRYKFEDEITGLFSIDRIRGELELDTMQRVLCDKVEGKQATLKKLRTDLEKREKQNTQNIAQLRILDMLNDNIEKAETEVMQAQNVLAGSLGWKQTSTTFHSSKAAMETYEANLFDEDDSFFDRSRQEPQETVRVIPTKPKRVRTVAPRIINADGSVRDGESLKEELEILLSKKEAAENELASLTAGDSQMSTDGDDDPLEMFMRENEKQLMADDCQKQEILINKFEKEIESIRKDLMLLEGKPKQPKTTEKQQHDESPIPPPKTSHLQEMDAKLKALTSTAARRAISAAAGVAPKEGVGRPSRGDDSESEDEIA